MIARAKLKLRRYGGDSQSKIGYWKDRLAADYFANFDSPQQLEKSVAIARVVQEHCDGAASLHELGVGAGRNIEHLQAALPGIAYSGNDLDEEACVRFMPPAVRAALTFHEQDTLSFLRERTGRGEQVDVVVAAGHLIHIPPDAIAEILQLMQRYARSWIVLHEGVTRRPDRRDDFWFLHDYRALEDDFDIIHEETFNPEHFSEYALRVYSKRRS